MLEKAAVVVVAVAVAVAVVVVVAVSVDVGVEEFKNVKGAHIYIIYTVYNMYNAARCKKITTNLERWRQEVFVSSPKVFLVFPHFSSDRKPAIS